MSYGNARLKKTKQDRRSVRLVIRWLRDKILDQEREIERAKRIVVNLEAWLAEDSHPQGERGE